MDVRIQDEALFVVPSSGALWSYDFGSKKRVISEAHGAASDPPFQVAQARVDDRDILLVSATLGAPSVAEQDAIRTMLHNHLGSARAVAFVLDAEPGFVSLVGSESELVEHFAAAAAVVRTVWSWDETKVFRILVDELEYEVSPKFDDEVWTATPALVRRSA